MLLEKWLKNLAEVRAAIVLTALIFDCYYD